MDFHGSQKKKSPVNSMILLAIFDVSRTQWMLKTYSHSIVAGGLPDTS